MSPPGRPDGERRTAQHEAAAARPVSVRPVAPSDAGAMAAIYNHYVRHTAISFEEEPISDADMAGRIDKTVQAGLPWLVAERDGRVSGYAYAGRWRERHAYRFAVESTVYVAPDAGGAGIGSALYRVLFERLRRDGYHTVIGVIALPNPASVALHEKFGMRQVAQLREVGFKFDRWHDVGNWQCVL